MYAYINVCWTWWAAKVDSHENGEKYALREFKDKVIQDNRIGHKSNRHMRLPIIVTNSNFSYTPRTLSKLRRRKGRKSPCGHTCVLFNASMRFLANTSMNLYGLKTRIDGYISVANCTCICLSALCSAWWAAKVDISVANNSIKDALRGFRVIQGHRNWYQSKGHSESNTWAIYQYLPIPGPYLARFRRLIRQ